MCQNLDELSASGNWDEVFHCLELDANSTIELGALRVPAHDDHLWLEEHKATLNSLEVILAVILLFDELFYFMFLWYLMCFSYKFVQYQLTKHTTLLKPKKPVIKKSWDEVEEPPKCMYQECWTFLRQLLNK